MAFCDVLRTLRERQGLSMRQLAEKSGVSAAEISRIESGFRQKPSPDLLRALAPALGVPYNTLMVEAGYLERVVEHAGHSEHLFHDEDGALADVYSHSRAINEKDQDLLRVMSRAAGELTPEDLTALKAVIQSFLAPDSAEAAALRTVAKSLAQGMETQERK